MSGSHEGKKKKKIKSTKSISFLSPIVISSAREGRDCNSGGKCNNNASLPLLPTPLRSEAAISDQSKDPWFLEDKVLFAHPGSY